jgi:drug/metabolite transporter (DMT)-like permease
MVIKMKARIYAKLLGFSLITGITFNLAQFSVRYFSAASAAAWRFGIAAVIMLFILIARKKVRFSTIQKNWRSYFLLGVVGIFGFNVCFFLGMKYTSPLNGALIMGTNPLLTSLLAFFLLKTKITREQLTGILFAFIGVVLVITHGSWDTIRSLSFSAGDLFILLGNACWALYGVLGRKFVKESSSMETTTYTMIVGAVCLIAAAIFSPSSHSQADVTIFAWGAILFMAVFTSVLGYLWWNSAIEAIGVGNTSIFFNVIPAVTMIISFITGNVIHVSQLVGTVFILVGVFVSSNLLKFRKNIVISHPLR